MTTVANEMWTEEMYHFRAEALRASLWSTRLSPLCHNAWQFPGRLLPPLGLRMSSAPSWTWSVWVRLADMKTETTAVILTELEWMLEG